MVFNRLFQTYLFVLSFDFVLIKIARIFLVYNKILYHQNKEYVFPFCMFF